MNTSNDIRFSTSKTVGKETITVFIRLNDECKNGHQDFSITGEIYKADRPKTDRNFISGGCIHEEIEKHFPQFIPFIRLHLCDYQGIPMHAVANGFYHLRNMTGDKFCEYYRVTKEQYQTLFSLQNQTQFGLALKGLGILEQWEKEAKEGIKTLEELTDTKFIIDSKKSQYIAPTAEEIEKEEQRQKEGYYTPEAEAKRAEAKKESILQKLGDELQKEIAKHTLEYEAKKEVFLKGGEAALKNCIFYNHTKEISFNWRGYDKLPDDFLNTLIASLQLPEGVTAKIAKS